MPAIFNNDIIIDCLSAIDLGKGIYLIPEGNNNIKINPDIDEKKLNELNRNNNGRGTNVIRLLKKWNAINNKPFKSYQLESLIYIILKNSGIQALDSGLKDFFKFGIDF